MRLPLTLFVPVDTRSELNTRGHWAARHRRFAQQRKDTRITFLVAGWRPGSTWTLPVVVRLTRHGRKLLDDDNVRGALKAVRDEVAAVLGVDDADPRVTWEYGQVQVRAQTGVGIEVRA